MKRSICTIILACFICSVSHTQENKHFSLNGYVSTMESIMFDSLKGTFTNENLIHNRLNFKAFAGKYFSFAVEFRNRFFTGDNIESTEGYADLVGSDDGLVDLSWNILNEKSVLFNTTIDRYWADLNMGKFQARIGRQRINWGQTFVWNPNDIFNTYSFFEVDYPERPGSDAVRLQYYPGSSSALEVAVKANSNKEITAATLYRFNRWGYDIQFLAGYVNGEDFVAGTGWSGAFGSISFRGEVSWFQPAKNFADSTGRGLFTIGFDKSFKDNSMAQIQIMYCNDPVSFSSFGSFYMGNLSAKDLAFSKFTAFGQFTIPATPLLNLSFSAMWFPDLKGCFIGPAMDYSLAENIDLSLFWQYFQSTLSGTRTRVNLGFLRLKYSF